MSIGIRRFFDFTWRVIRHFFRNRGLLLAGAVGYNGLLSIVPLLALILVVLSELFDEDQLLMLVQTELENVLPIQASGLTDALASFLDHRDVISWVGIAALLFFGSLAFRVLEEAMAAIFHRKVPSERSRHPVISALIPLAYMLVITLAILLLSLVSIAFDALPEGGVSLWGYELSTETGYGLLLETVTFLGLMLFFASFYRVMPVVRVRFRAALIGGVVCAVLWELVRAILVWYFAQISLVSLIYGSLGAIVVLLLSMEIAAIILLLGAQVIAELEGCQLAGLHWYEDPEKAGPQPP